MKLRILILLLPFTLLHTNILHAQDQDPEPRSLFGSGHQHANGGWGGPAVALTEVMGTEALLVGLHAGWLIDHRFTLGLAGYGLVTDVPNQGYDAYLLESGRILNQGSQFRMGYGGLLLEPIIAYKSPVHVSLPIIVGAGGCAYETYGPRPDDFDPETYDYRSEGQAFFVVEPGLEVELNLVRLVRIGLGASYRYTTDIDLPATPSDALRGFNTSLSLKVGRF